MLRSFHRFIHSNMDCQVMMMQVIEDFSTLKLDVFLSTECTQLFFQLIRFFYHGIDRQSL